MTKIIPVVMCGGSGTRLWPLSRQAYPKQFLPLTSTQSMLQETLIRLPDNVRTEAICICNEEHRFMVAEQLRILQQNSKIILEPEGRNTAPAIALAAFNIIKEHGDALMLVLASDHVIQQPEAFLQTLTVAQQAAQQDKLATFGIVPTSPETGYGYIKVGSSVANDINNIDCFVEKPSLATAQQYLASGEYLWNSGMFLFKASQYLLALQKHAPQIYQQCRLAMENTTTDLDFIRPDSNAFIACPDDSIDYAVMEKTSNGVVVALDAGWSDVGSYAALWDVSEKTEQNNVIKGDVVCVDTDNSYLHGSDKLIATVGVNNLVVVDTPDAVLIADKNKVQEVKSIVAQLKQQQRPEVTFHRKVYRPWGNYDSVDTGERFQVKRITVNAGAKLSVQMHHHRAEHWIIVSGTAKVTIDDDTFLLTENQSTYIPIGAVHALENPGKLPLEMIEVQSGSYLGEDDIVRFEDRYGRVNKEETDA